MLDPSYKAFHIKLHTQTDDPGQLLVPSGLFARCAKKEGRVKEYESRGSDPTGVSVRRETRWYGAQDEVCFGLASQRSCRSGCWIVGQAFARTATRVSLGMHGFCMFLRLDGCVIDLRLRPESGVPSAPQVHVYGPCSLVGMVICLLLSGHAFGLGLGPSSALS
jgi:hypothetical protein